MRDWISVTVQDLRFAARTCARRPGFATLAILTLGLGIGATTTVFSIVDAVLLRPLPYRQPDRLAAVWITSTREASLAKLFATYQDYSEFARHSQSFDSVAAATWAKRSPSVLTGYGPARDILAIPASSGFFEMLGVRAARGRTFTRDDEVRGCSLVLAHPFWTSTLGADAGIVGKSLTIDQKPCTVLGIMPADFSFYPRQTQAWILLGPGFQDDLNAMQVGIFARLKAGVTPSQAQAELRGLYRPIHLTGETRDFQPVVYDLQGEFTFLAGRTLSRTLLVLFGAVLLVMLIGCLNVANLLMARLSERRRELAVRAALGSGQGRLVRQVLTESLLLSGMGATAGIAIAAAALRYFRYANPIELRVGAEVELHLGVLGFSAALSIAATVIIGLLPAIRASRVDPASQLMGAGRGAVAGRQALSRTVIAVQVALSFLLLVGAGLLMTSALRMGSASLGFNPEHLLAARATLPAYRYRTSAQRRQAYDRLLEQVERLPGVQAVALSSKLPPEAGGNQTLQIQGRDVAPGSEAHDVGADAVSPRFFELLQIPVRRGRSFTAQDREQSQPVAIVNEALVRAYFPDRDPLGRQIRIPGGDMPWLTIVGVAGNLKHTQLMNEMSWVETPILYRPLAQEPRQSMQIALRTSGSVPSLSALDPGIPISDPEPLAARLSKTLAFPRFRAAILAFFAAGALLLSAVGLHGVLSQLVTQRTQEFGVRRAVGAQTHHLLLLVATQGGLPVVAGLAIGLGAATVLRRVLASLLYGIEPADPAILASVSALLLTVAGLAILLPATRAARVDPMTALREG